MILLNNVFTWLVQSHDLFRGADTIRWLVEIVEMHTWTSMVAIFVFFCEITMSTVTRMDGSSTYASQPPSETKGKSSQNIRKIKRDRRISDFYVLSDVAEFSDFSNKKIPHR